MGLSQKEIETINRFQEMGGDQIEDDKLNHQELTQCLVLARELGRPLSFICERYIQAKQDMVVRNQ
jgi:hypothetical protein